MTYSQWAGATQGDLIGVADLGLMPAGGKGCGLGRAGLLGESSEA